MDKVTRRGFVKGTAATTAGLLLGTSKTSWAGANDRIRIAVLGINGRGKSHLSGFSALDGVEVTTLCDPDSRLFKPRSEAYFTKRGKPAPKVEQDLRRVIEDKNIDAISIATPNHWHSLATIWACQAGKDVYVEKPMTHNIYEGRKVIDAVKKYGRIVQHGTQLRSSAGFQEGIKLLKDGFIGDVYMARCVCYKWRPSIGKAHPGNPPKELDWNIWQGPAQEQPFMLNEKNEGIYVPYYWHWVWAYGNGDIGNQGVHQLDAARWGLGVDVPYRCASMGGMFLWDDAKEVFNVSSSSFMFKGPDGKDKMMTLEVRPWYTNDESGGTTFGVIFYGSEGYMSFPSYSGYKAYKGDTATGKLVKENSQGGDHFLNFIDCMRTRKPESLNAPAREGHYSSALSHYALTAARVNRVLEIDTKTEQVKNDDEANRMLTRVYRAPFVVPEKV
ncbi:MAG: Gfo/Idh/MocA family oxidoreductase [Phycisphaerae bacterium]|nr:Gfo/Idh/MocA family oxidoreductase [Phycisphaerae bacterium]